MIKIKKNMLIYTLSQIFFILFLDLRKTNSPQEFKDDVKYLPLWIIISTTE